MNNINFNFNSYLEEDILLQDGVYSAIAKTDVSFPEDGCKNCFQIEDDSWWFKHRNNCICSVVKSYSKDEIFFDVGGGNGKVAKHLQDNNVRVVMIEAGKEGIINARSRGIDNLVHANLNDLDIKESSIPSIGMFDVLEHIEDDMSCLSNIHRCLKHGGYYYLTVPAYQGLWSYDDVVAGHYRRYAMRSLKRKLKAVGFEISYATYIFQYLPLPILIKRVLPFRFRFMKNRGIEASKDDHVSKASSGKVLESLHRRELQKITKNKPMNFGGSILLVARKAA